MGWSNSEPQKTKQGMETSSKILIAIIGCVLLIIILIAALLINIEQTTYTISVNGEVVGTTVDDGKDLLAKINDITYVNIKEFSKLVGYEYHDGEYKAFTVEEGKCYVQCEEETATFYLNENKVYKLPVEEFDEDYYEFNVEYPIILNENKMYASLDAIKTAFNVVIEQTKKSFDIYTLDILVKSYDSQVQKWGYTGIKDQTFENNKTILYDCLIVKKEDGLYKIIDTDNTKEIVLDKYTDIEFSESAKKFFVTDNLDKVGIINLDGTIKLEPIYDSIEELEENLYLVQKDKKYGIVKSGDITVIPLEYDKIGTDVIINKEEKNQYMFLDELIPVCKNNKWGAYNKKGELVYKLEYSGFGCNKTTIKVGESEKTVNPVYTIERCNGIVVQVGEKYGVLDKNGKELVPIAVEAIYELTNYESEDSKYFMLYNGKELDIIERLKIAGLLKEENETELNEEDINKNNISSQNLVNTNGENISNNMPS